jgi:hypothetical protein
VKLTVPLERLQAPVLEEASMEKLTGRPELADAAGV